LVKALSVSARLEAGERLEQELARRLDVAIEIATNESVPVDTSGIKSEVAHYAFAKINQQWVYVRDVLIALRAEVKS